MTLVSLYTLSRATHLECGKVMAVLWASGAAGRLFFFFNFYVAHEVDIQGGEEPFLHTVPVEKKLV